MNRIKTSWELALEKSQSAKKLETEKINDLAVQKYIKAAETLAKGYLEGKTSLSNLKETLEKYPAEVYPRAVEALLKALAGEINLDNCHGVLEAVRAIKNDDLTSRTCRELARLHARYSAQRGEALQKLERAACRSRLAELKKAGIYGSAIKGFNVKNSARWKELSSQIEKEFKNVIEKQLFLITRVPGEK